jgi:hypothetical protein
MNKTLTLLLTLAFPPLTFAQLSFTPSKSENWKLFKASKTYFVIGDDKRFNEGLAKAAEVWKITPGQLVDSLEMVVKLKDPKNSIVTLFTLPSSTPGKEFHALVLVMGGKKGLADISYTDILACAPIDHHGSEPSNIDCYYRLPNMLQSLQATMENVNAEPNVPAAGVNKALIRFYRSRSAYIKDRTLLVCSEDLGDKLDEETFKTLYTYPFEICEKSKIAGAIAAKDNKYYYLQPALTQGKYIFVLDPVNGDVIYGLNELAGSLTKANLQDLAATIEGKE